LEGAFVFTKKETKTNQMETPNDDLDDNRPPTVNEDVETSQCFSEVDAEFDPLLPKVHLAIKRKKKSTATSSSKTLLTKPKANNFPIQTLPRTKRIRDHTAKPISTPLSLFSSPTTPWWKMHFVDGVFCKLFLPPSENSDESKFNPFEKSTYACIWENQK
jgi:hypothetical protein